MKYFAVSFHIEVRVWIAAMPKLKRCRKNHPETLKAQIKFKIGAPGSLQFAARVEPVAGSSALRLSEAHPTREHDPHPLLFYAGRPKRRSDQKMLTIRKVARRFVRLKGFQVY